MHVRMLYGYLTLTTVMYSFLFILWLLNNAGNTLPSMKKMPATGIFVQFIRNNVSLDQSEIALDMPIISSNKTTDVTLQNGICKGAVFPLHLVKADTWLPFDQTLSIYVFSAYMIQAKRTIFIIGAKMRKLEVTAICQMWKWEENGDTLLMEVSNAYSVTPQEGPSDRKYSATIIECPLKTSFKPTHVSLATTTCGTPRNVMAVYDVITPEVYNHTFTVCLSPLFYEFGGASTLVEWFELNRILGADQFVVYNHSVASNVDHVLRYYSKRGLAKVIQWRPPMGVNTKLKTNQSVEIHYFGQAAAVNDCLFRSKASSEFLVNIDLDEFIIPHASNVTDWSNMLQKIEKPKAVTYMFRSTYFRMEWNNTKVDFPERNLVEKLRLTTLQKFDHEAMIFPAKHRSKYIVRTSGADWIQIHDVPKTQLIVAPTEVGLVHHYRYWGNKDEKKTRITDVTIKQKFGQNLIRNVRNVWKDLANVPLYTYITNAF